MGEEITDDVLIKRVQDGDSRAFDLLVVKYQQRVLAVISRYVRDWGDAQDVAQDTFVRAYKAINKFRGDSQFYTWLYRIAVNTAKNHLVSRGRRPPSDDVEVSDAEHYDGGVYLRDSDTPERELMRQEMEQTVLGVVETLPDELRQALTLREVQGLSYEEIAAQMDCPIGTVRSRIFRARDAIDQQLQALTDKERVRP